MLKSEQRIPQQFVVLTDFLLQYEGKGELNYKIWRVYTIFHHNKVLCSFVSQTTYLTTRLKQTQLPYFEKTNQ